MDELVPQRNESETRIYPTFVFALFEFQTFRWVELDEAAVRTFASDVRNEIVLGALGT